VSPVPGLTLFDFTAKMETEEAALFGEVNLNLTDRLDLTLGGRGFTNEFDLRSSSTGLISGLPPGVVITDASAADESGFNPKLVLSYRY
jgi:outer membrane receptor protein involved in Fe transport